MKVTIKLYTEFRRISGKKIIEIELNDGTTILTAIKYVAREHKLGKKLFNGEELIEWVKVLVNGRNINFLDGKNTILRNGDLIDLFPPSAGG